MDTERLKNTISYRGYADAFADFNRRGGRFYCAKKYAEAKKNLSEVVSIAGIAENKVLYPNEKKKAEAFLSKIPQ